MGGMCGLISPADGRERGIAREVPTIRDFIRISGRGRLNNPWVGGPKEVADMFEEYFTAPACDGFGGPIAPDRGRYRVVATTAGRPDFISGSGHHADARIDAGCDH